MPFSAARWRVLSASCVCVSLAVIAVVVVDGGESNPQPGGRGQHGWAGTSRQQAAAADQARAVQRRLASPRARSLRRGSRTAFADLSRRAALRVDRAVPGSALGTSTPRPLQAAREEGMTVAHFPSRYAAVLRPGRE